MKTLNLILAASLLAFTSFGQNSPRELVRERVGDKTIVENWNVGETKAMNGVKVLRLEGENGIDDRTNMFYIPQSSVLNAINEKEPVGVLYNKELRVLTDFSNNNFPGGQVALFFDRTSPTLANPENFTVQVIDAITFKVLLETTLDYQAPYYFKAGIWYYYTTVNIPEKTGEQFIVRVRDAGLNQFSEFLVYDNFSAPQLPPSILSAAK